MRKYLKLCCKAIESQPFKLSTLTSKFPLENETLSVRKLRHKRREFADLLQLQVKSEEPILYYTKIHGQMVVSGCHSDTFLANILMNSCSKSGCVRYARKLFDKMPKRNLISWSTLTTMYAQNGYYEEALLVFLEFLRSSDETANEFIVASVVRACGQLGAVCLGSQVHAFVVKYGLDQDVYVGTTLIDLYSKSGNMDTAGTVFDELSVKTSVTWTTILTGYTRIGRGDVALMLFLRMKDDGIVPDRYVLSSILSACSLLKHLEGGKQLHAYVLRRGTEMDASVMNVLIDFYTKCGRVRSGRTLFDRMVSKNLISWTTIISGCMQNSCDVEAMELFAQMNRLGWKADGFACTSVLTSCGSLEALRPGRQVHAYTIKVNIQSDEFVKNGLIDMYSKCEALFDARRVFDTISEHNIVSYNAMIEGYARQEKLHEALDLFRVLRRQMFPSNLLTFVSLLGVSSSLFEIDLSKQIHGLIKKIGVSLDVFAGSALIDVYSKCSLVADARLVFDEVKEKDLVVWNAMLFGYTQQMESEEALKLYHRLQVSGQKPNEFTYVALITAASNLASIQQGQQFHSQLVKTSLDLDPFVTNALVDMYAKCGSLEEAQKVFDSAKRRDIPCWNSIISTYAHHGEAEEALLVYERMLKEGLQPNYVTFVGVLSACSHAGLVDLGLDYFNSMRCYGINQPGMEHYACMVSLFGRAGKLTEAKEFIERMPMEPAPIVWRSLLSACRVSGNAELGAYAAEKAISSDSSDSGSYILLSNIYAGKGMWDQVKGVRRRMESSGVVKEPGRSWIELNNEVHVFVAKDNTHSKADLIFSVLDGVIEQMKVLGHAPEGAALLNPNGCLSLEFLSSYDQVSEDHLSN